MKSETTKPTFRGPYRDFAETHLQRKFGELSDTQRSFALLKFYVTTIENRLRRAISDDEFDEGIVDGAGDLGADFIYCDDGVVLIIQSKYAGQEVKIELDAINHFQTIFGRMTDPEFRDKANSKLREALGSIDFSSDRFELRFVSLGRIVGQAETQASKSAEFPKIDGLADRVSFEFLDERLLNEEYRQALSQDQVIQTEEEIVTFGSRGKRTGIIDLTAGARSSCVMVVPASQIINLYKSLFTLNVRNYIGNTATNKAIIQTATESAPDFYQMNNGISCLAKNLTVGEDRVKVTGLQVINGAQTVKALFKAYSRNPWKSAESEPGLLMRITELAAYGKEAGFRDRIVRANNTQNVIKVSDFRSNDPIQSDLEKKFESNRRFGKVVQYIAKRTDRTKSNSVAIPLEAFAKSVYAFLRDPIRFSGSTSFLFDDTDAGGYQYIFGDGKEVWTSMPEGEFRLRSAIWWLANEFGNRLKNDRNSTDDVREKAALERKWPFIFCSRLLLERSYGMGGYVDDLSKTFKGEWRFGEGRYGQWFDEIYEKAKRTVTYVYIQAAKQSNFVHRNWMRSEKTVEALEEYVRHAPIDPIKKL